MSTPSLEVMITAGPTAGQIVRVNRSPAPFGRDPDNALVIDLPTVSRVHGELRLDDQQWVIVNHSANGTALNRRALGRKPRPLGDGDQVVIGDQPVLAIGLRDGQGHAIVSQDPQDVGATPDAPTASAMNPRTKLWLGIVGFWVIVFAAALFLSGGEETDPDDGPVLTLLSPQEIANAIRQPLPEQEPSTPTAVKHFNNATAADQLINADGRNAFRAYYSYKSALSYAYGDDFTDSRDNWGGKPAAELALAQKRYLELEDRLVRDVTRLYEDAAGKMRDGRYADARRSFQDVFDLYNDPGSLIYKNAMRQRDLARRRLAPRD